MEQEINHPSYYNHGGTECIEIMRQVFGKEAVYHFCLCNAFKYIYRCESKHKTPLDDLDKARWYIDYIIENKDIADAERIKQLVDFR